tara:strand:+ start:707 stop:907 length:201 start_codon:yes stop_codon:yes gene_type:complete
MDPVMTPMKIPRPSLRKYSRIIENITIMNETKIMDSYKVETGGLLMISILKMIPYPWNKAPEIKKI